MIDQKAVAIVGVGAVLPDAPDAASFWRNIQADRYSITEVPPDRWRPELYYHPDASQPDKTYSKIGAWVRDYRFDPLKLGLAIPPRVLDQMDPARSGRLPHFAHCHQSQSARAGQRKATWCLTRAWWLPKAAFTLRSTTTAPVRCRTALRMS